MQIKRIDLCGGMQERLNRQEQIRYKKAVNKMKEKIKIKNNDNKSFSISSDKSFEEKFNEPVLKRIRSNRGFFNE